MRPAPRTLTDATAGLSWARPGVTCICIAAPNGRWHNRDTGEQIIGPRRGQALTILSTAEDDGLVLAFAEWPDRYFAGQWFRPVAKRSLAQDIALFAHHLKRAPVGDEVAA